MHRSARLHGLQMGIALCGALVLALTVGGCQEGLFPFGAGAGTLNVGGTASEAATVGKTVTLTADVSNGTAPYTFAWTQTGGPTVTLTGADTASATFVPNAGGIYSFEVASTDAGPVKQRGLARVDLAVGDIQFVVPTGSYSYYGAFTMKPGNPALLQTDERAEAIYFEARARVFDPEFIDDQVTQMQVHYALVSVPTGARVEDVSLDREFDTISNQGTGDMDYDPGSGQDLDGVVGVLIRPNPDAAFEGLTNVATLVQAFGELVPGAYMLRATVTNPNGVQRTRDLPVTVVVQGIDGPTGTGGDYGAISSGPTTVAVKQLPAGSPGFVTDKVMLPTQSTSMVVTVFPSTTTSYRFYLLDNNGVAYPSLVATTPTATGLAATGSPTDITLTIASEAGLPVGTHELWMESFDGLANLMNVPVVVNRLSSTDFTNVRFHVTQDFYAQSAINGAHVDSASNNVDDPVIYEGWSDIPTGYGNITILADVNLDGAPDLITTNASGFSINTQGYLDGSAAALRHPDNSGNFDGELATPVSVTGIGTVTQLAVGDLNGDNLPDLAATVVTGGVGRVLVFFHTGSPFIPYGISADQTLTINPPTYTTRLFFDSTNPGNVEIGPIFFNGAITLFRPSEPATSAFGTRIAIANVVGDDKLDLIITDPGFSKMQAYNAAGPRPAALTDFYNDQTGRVYVFAGGATGNLKPNRPDIVTSIVDDWGTMNITVPGTAISTTFAEREVEYTAAFTGVNAGDFIGFSLAAASTFAVGSPLATADGLPFVRLVFNIDNFGLDVPDGATITTVYGGVTRIYEFDTNAALVNAGAVAVDISVAGNALPRIALGLLRDTVNADVDRVMDCLDDPVLPIGSAVTSDDVALIFRGIAGTATETFGNTDEWVRSRGAALVCSVAANGLGGDLLANGTYLLAFNRDGIVERQGATALENVIKGTASSNMGLGATLAIGNFNNNGGKNDLLIAASDSGADLGATGDGAVFVVLDGATTLPAAVAGVGADTLGAPGGIAPTGVGSAVGAGDVNGDGIDDLFFTEPGFDRIYMIKGAATPSTTPNLTITDVQYNASLGTAGSFVIGDFTGDTEVDWMFINSGAAFGFAGFER